MGDNFPTFFLKSRFTFKKNSGFDTQHALFKIATHSTTNEPTRDERRRRRILLFFSRLVRFFSCRVCEAHQNKSGATKENWCLLLLLLKSKSPRDFFFPPVSRCFFFRWRSTESASREDDDEKKGFARSFQARLRFLRIKRTAPEETEEEEEEACPLLLARSPGRTRETLCHPRQNDCAF